MRSLLSQVSRVYSGYRGDGQPHIPRLLVAVCVALTISATSKSLNKDALSMMAVIVSVLAGFSFTALFSSHSHSANDLPTAISENDRQDLLILNKLFNNFKDRSRYFLSLGVICLVLFFY